MLNIKKVKIFVLLYFQKQFTPRLFDNTLKKCQAIKKNIHIYKSGLFTQLRQSFYSNL